MGGGFGVMLFGGWLFWGGLVGWCGGGEVEVECRNSEFSCTWGGGNSFSTHDPRGFRVLRGAFWGLRGFLFRNPLFFFFLTLGQIFFSMFFISVFSYDVFFFSSGYFSGKQCARQEKVSKKFSVQNFLCLHQPCVQLK